MRVAGVQCAGDAGTVAVVVENRGAIRVPSYTVGYRIGTGAWVEQTINRPLAPGASATHVFPGRPTFSTAGDVALSGRVTATGDVVASNDQLDTTMAVAPVVVFDGSAPYTADFETDAQGWTAGGTNSSWQLGEPSGMGISSAASGRMAWVTNLTGRYHSHEQSYLYSPCFDMSAASRDPALQLQRIYTFGSGDGAWVEVSYNRGLTWTKLGSATSGGLNWYNDTRNDRWDGNVSSWDVAAHPLLGAAGHGWVRFRFVMQSDGFSEDEGIGIDDVQLLP